MTICSVKVEIPDGWELADESMRSPKFHEHYISAISGNVLVSRAAADRPRVIVRRDWEGPLWRLARWIAMDKAGSWQAFPNIMPTIPVGTFWSAIDMARPSFLAPDCLAFDPPPCANWRNSLRENPNFVS